MSTAYTQERRLLQIETPLGTDEVFLTRLSGAEEMSRLFRYQLDLISQNARVTAKDLVGQPVTMAIRQRDGSKTYFNGHVSRFAAGGVDERGFRHYRAEVVPWLWFLTRTSNCRIFQNKTIPQIIEEVLGLWGYADYETAEISGQHPTWEYCVQYRETDFNFISRLAEQAGIYFYFRHEDGKHVLVFGDSPSGYGTSSPAEVECFEGSPDKDYVSEWEHHYEFRPGKWAMTDYNFQTPSTSLLASTSTLVDLPGADKYEMFDYPGEYAAKGDGEALVKLRMEEDEVAHEVVDGSSNCRNIATGHTFTLARHAVSDEVGKEYVAVRVYHAAVDESYLGGAQDERYSNEFTCIPAAVAFRPQRVTPKPSVHGLQPAVVVGEGEIAADEYGRVKVKFPWIRSGVGGDETSCWIRVAQNWAGNKWGVLFNPRVGQEVVVSFVEGDPDRPLIIGRVYNAEQMPPYDPKSQGTISTIKTRSSEGGDPDTFNEIRFEDKKGSEELYFHAEKDQTVVVENDRNELVGHDRTLTVKNDKSEEVDHNKLIKVHGEHTESIDGGMTISVSKSLTESVGVNYAETVGAAMELTVGGAYAVTVGALMAETIGAQKTSNVAGSSNESVGASKELEVGKDLSESVGGNHKLEIKKDSTEGVTGQRKVTVGKDFVLNADTIQLVAKKEITIKTGSAELIMKKNGDITLKGKKINIKGSGDVIVKGSQIKEN